MLSANLSAVFYLISGVLFILALRGLSSPETSRQGNFFGILGMIIAVTVTFLSIGNFSTGLVVVLIFLLIGGLIGAFIAYKIPMTAMPELVAGFHSLVGLAAVFVAIAAFLNPEAFNLGSPGNIKIASLIEMSLGASIGAITFTGSIIAFLKLRGIMAIPAPTKDPLEQREQFNRIAGLLNIPGLPMGMKELSMGMSADMEAAISEGATMVRIGTDIFGARYT